MTILDKVLENPEAYSIDVERLGECKLDSPVRSRDFIRDDDRILITQNARWLDYLENKLGRRPTF